MCVALTDQNHTVRNVGDDEVIMFLSVTPHIQPTHTYWNDDGTKQPPRFAAAGAYDEQPDRTTPTTEIAARQAAAAATVAQSATDAATVQQEQLAATGRRWRLATKPPPTPRATRCGRRLSELFSRTMELAASWNDFAAHSATP